MACKNEGERKCFTFIWKVENASYFEQENNGFIQSPYFVLDGTEGTKLSLVLSLRCGEEKNLTLLYLRGLQPGRIEAVAVFDWELAFLALDGSVLLSSNNNDWPLDIPGLRMDSNDLFVTKSSEFLPHDTLTVRLRMWKADGEMSNDVHCIARTRIGVEKRLFMWKIRNFSSLRPDDKNSYEIKSLETDEPLIILDFVVTTGLNSVEEIRFSVTPKNSKIKCCVFHLSREEASGNIVECLKDEFRFDTFGVKKEFTRFLNRNTLTEKKSEYLPNDVLSLKCMCRFTSGIMTTEIEETSFDGTTFEKNGTVGNLCSDKDVLAKFQNVLNVEMKSLLMDSIHSDIKLRVRSKSYSAHKCILSARSPVFRAMFSNDMRENTSDCVYIEDLNDDTVFRLLQYIYSAEVEKLEWDDATELYEAADKYQIPTLKDICASFLKTNLCQNNACEGLLLADLHQDEELKSFVQDFILKHGKEILNSEEWKELMKTNVDLAAETVYLKFKNS